MASFRKLPNGTWRTEVCKLGIRDSKVADTKAEVVSWAAMREAQILAGEKAPWPRKTLSDAFERYKKEVSSEKRGGRSECVRMDAFMRNFPGISAKVISEIVANDLVGWRDSRKKTVGNNSIIREAATFRNVFAVAAGEWGWLAEPTPWAKVKLPGKGHARTRLPTRDEIKRLLRAFGYKTGQAPVTLQQEIAYCWLGCLQTGMRAGEYRGMTVDDVDLKRRVVTLHTHKTLEKDGKRKVPFTAKSAQILRVLVGNAVANGRQNLFEVSSGSLDVLFRKVRDYQLIKGLRFHDSRAFALTRLSRKYDVLTLARISGHKDLKQLLNAYYRESSESVAARI